MITIFIGRSCLIRIKQICRVKCRFNIDHACGVVVVSIYLFSNLTYGSTDPGIADQCMVSRNINLQPENPAVVTTFQDIGSGLAFLGRGKAESSADSVLADNLCVTGYRGIHVLSVANTHSDSTADMVLAFYSS